jgi:hypothetical protein
VAARELPEKFLVAFSLAGEQRELVQAIAEEVERALGPSTVFYDGWFEYYIAGNDADIKLQRIYHERCELAIACVSSNYADKPWTQDEYRAIRARYRDAAGSERDSLRVLAIRVGDGEVEGIFTNAITPDARKKTVKETAQLVIDRLALVQKSPKPVNSAVEWPEQPPALHWPMADHTEARAAFGTLLTKSSPIRLLSVSGPSDTGKSHISRQMVLNGLRLPSLLCGRFDFKGTTGMDIEMEALVQSLQLKKPSAARLNEQFGQILHELNQMARPTLLIFDTYEAAGEGKDWVERVLLLELVRSTWLRAVVLGQSIPSRTGTTWESIAAAPIVLRPPGPEEWLEYGREHRPEEEYDLAFAIRVHQAVSGKATHLAGVFGPR